MTVIDGRIYKKVEQRVKHTQLEFRCGFEMKEVSRIRVNANIPRCKLRGLYTKAFFQSPIEPQTKTKKKRN